MLLVHAGFPKTGTTSLQHIFAREASTSHRLLYLGPTGVPDNPRLGTLRSRGWINFVRDVKLQRKRVELAQRFRELRDRHPNARSFTDIIISDEMLSQSISEDWTTSAVWENIERVVDATHVNRSEVVVLLGVRDADTLLPSQFAENRRKLRSRFSSVNEFLQFMLDGGWPGFTERFDAEALRNRADALGLRLHLLPMASIRSAEWVGPAGLLDDVFPWSREHLLPALNVRGGDVLRWHSDEITLFDRVEVVARRLPIRMPPEPLYRGLKKTLGRVRLEPAREVDPDPVLLKEVRERFGSVEDAAQERRS